MASQVEVTDAQFSRLRRYNWIMGALHGLQGAAVVALATDFTLPITASFPEGPPGTPAPAPEVLFDLSIAWGVATFLFLSALFHFLIASIGASRYRDQLSRGQNQFRWIEYSLSSSVMIVLIAMLPGITNIAALLGLFGVNAGMIFFGSVQERYEEPGGSLWPFWMGTALGVIPWIAISIYLVSPGSEAQPPGFVYGIFFSLFVFFNSFAFTQWAQYRQVGKWKNYLTGERTYILLSLLAKSALAWQVFAGTLVPPA
ncbi:MAG: heliorhodopsin HeR [Acidimicrobiia bacterium]|nr:heliorhodopsin HeR [Acidimicrobiia bacterium]